MPNVTAGKQALIKERAFFQFMIGKADGQVRPKIRKIVKIPYE